MKIMQINATYNIGSTGKIMKDLNTIIEKSGYSGFMLCAYSNDEVGHLFRTEFQPYYIATRKNILMSRITGRMGYGQKAKTKKAIQWIDIVNPDIIHLHNIHGNWINIPMLMKYIKTKQKNIVWTLHDCWSFTGRCSNFEHYGCFRWKKGCYKCSNNMVYPLSYFFDHSKKMWQNKKDWFGDMKEPVLVTPSKWLSNYVKQSFLCNYDIAVINNGIDLSLFNVHKSRSRYLKSVGSKKVVLGVASSWTDLKGLGDFYQLNSMLDPNIYQIVLVGLSRKQLKAVPVGIIGIGRTNNVKELAELYSMASVFVNPTYQDNYPTVNLEAIACGTPVITYKTGGSIESVTEAVGIVVDQGDLKTLKTTIEDVCINCKYSSRECRQYALENFDKDKKYIEYIRLYQRVLGLSARI